MTFYYMIFLFLFLSVLLGKIYNRIQSILFFLWIIFFATITAIRDGVGTDFESYVGIFEITPQWDSLFSTMPLVDWGFWYYFFFYLFYFFYYFGINIFYSFIFFYFIYNYIVTLFCI